MTYRWREVMPVAVKRYPARTEAEARAQLAALEHDQIHRRIEASAYYTERRRLIRLALGTREEMETP
jgi:hypothetical protein